MPLEIADVFVALFFALHKKASIWLGSFAIIVSLLSDNVVAKVQHITIAHAMGQLCKSEPTSVGNPT